LKQISDEPTLISPISPIENKRTPPSTEKCVPEIQPQKKPVQSVQPQKKPTQQESLSNQSVQPKKLSQQESLSNQSIKNNYYTPTQKRVSEPPNPVKILSIKQSDPEPIHVQPKQTQSASPTIQSDYLDFLSETLQSLQTTSFDSNLWNPENVNKTVPEKKQNKTFTNRNITKVTFETPLKPKHTSKINYEIPDLLPQPEPISPIKLTFSDFIISPNGTSTNLNLNEENEKSDFLDMMSTKQFDNVVKPEGKINNSLSSIIRMLLL